MRQAPCGLFNLPPELLLQILSNTHWSDYYCLCRTSRLLRRLANIPSSLSASRYGYLPPFSSMVISPSEDPPFQIHRIFSCAFYRNGCSSYAISIPAIGSHPKEIDRKFSISGSPFREDAFSYPDCNKIVISWANVNSLRLSDVTRSTGPNPRSSLGSHHGALYINNLIVGTGYQKTPSAICGSNVPNTLDAEMTGIVDANEVSIPYITVEDVFNAFERDHPELKDRKAGEAKIVGFHHVFHPGVGARAGSHFEVEWLWVEDGGL